MSEPLLVVLADDTDAEDHSVLFPLLRERGIAARRVHPHELTIRLDGARARVSVGGQQLRPEQGEGVVDHPHPEALEQVELGHARQEQVVEDPAEGQVGPEALPVDRDPRAGTVESDGQLVRMHAPGRDPALTQQGGTAPSDLRRRCRRRGRRA